MIPQNTKKLPYKNMIEVILPDIITCDDLDDSKYNDIHEQFDGKILDHHMFGELPLKYINGKLIAELNLKCNNIDCISWITRKCYLGAGLNAGAWCYVYDPDTLEIVANLRDDVFVCSDCKVGDK